MKAGPLTLTRFTPRLGLASLRRRLIVRGAFLLLIAATLALAVVLLREEKARSLAAHQLSFAKTRAEVLARLRHPSGLLALLNPTVGAGAVTPLKPLLLPYSAIDFDDQAKAQQAVELAGCSVRYPNGASLCVAIGANPYAGGFIYLVGGFLAGELTARVRGALELEAVHRARVTVTMRSTTSRWIAPFEAMEPRSPAISRGRLTGFIDNGSTTLAPTARPVRDFRGWLWQPQHCATLTDPMPACARHTSFSIRLPIESFRAALFEGVPPQWPPADLDRIEVQFEMYGPGTTVLFDSNAGGATPPPSLNDVALSLQPGETLRIRRGGAGGVELARRSGAAQPAPAVPPWLDRLIRWLPVGDFPAQLEARDLLPTAIANYELALTSDLRRVEQNLGLVAQRLWGFVAAMLGAIGIAWLVVEVGFIRPIALLTRRAAAVSYNVQDARFDQRLGDLEVADLRGSDEVGILAGSLADLLRRVKNDVAREHIRAAQERDMWQAVGHEIMSPLQSLMVLHGKPDDPGHRYVQRMQQAVHVFYGTASPSEALAAATAHTGVIDLDAFLRNVAENAQFAGIDAVRYESAATPVMVRADEYFLEDVMTHILANANRHRAPNTPITLGLVSGEAEASVTIQNEGAGIEPTLIHRIFEYGVSDRDSARAPEHRGQGLFVAKTYMAKMGGTISVRNANDGVVFDLTLQRSAT